MSVTQSDNSFASQDGVLSDAKSAGKGDPGKVRRWKLEINLADKLESDWRKSGNGARDIYRGKKKAQNSFNILWANTEVIRPNLYNSTPKPDVRRRYRDADQNGKMIADVIERSLSFEADSCDFDGVMESAVFDAALPGRGTARIRFEPYFNDDGGLAGAKTYPERVAWDTFRRGPGSCWEDVPWLAYRHELTKDEVKAKFAGFENKVQYDVVLKGATEEQANSEPNVFKRVLIWEIWDKETRKVFWMAPSCEDELLLEEDDKLKLKDFFDMPKPIYAIDDTSTLEPVCEYTLYEDQAKELNRVTQRINKLTEALKIRGIYDATLTEISDLLNAGDGDMLPTKDATAAMQAGGFEKAIWLQPIEQIAKVLAQLYLQREQIKMTIYEVIGISDILRGQSDPNETLGAQELKAQSGSVRLQRRQREVQRFARDLFRIMSEIICEHYPAELLTIMTGVQVTPEMQQVMQRDLLRGISVDVETDSTIAADQAKVRKDVAEVLEAVGGFVTSFGPAVESGAVSVEAAKKILVSIVRKAKLGRDVEDAMEAEAQQPVQQKPDPEMMKLQAEQQSKQADMQIKQQEMGMKAQESQANLQMEGSKLQLEQAKIEQQAQLERERMQMDAQLKREQMMLDAQIKRESETLKQQTSIETERMRGEASSKPTTTVSLDAGDAMQVVGQKLTEMADEMGKTQQINQTALQQAVETMAQAANAIAMAVTEFNSPKTAVVTRRGGELIGTIQPAKPTAH